MSEDPGVGSGAEAVPVASLDAVGAADVRPDHLRGYRSVEEAWQALERDHPRVASFGDAVDAYEAGRRDSSDRLRRWINGES